MNFRAWIKKDKKMVGVKLIGGGYLWDSNTWLDINTDMMATAHEIGVTCEVVRGTGVVCKNGEIFEHDLIRIPKEFPMDVWRVLYDRWGIPALACERYPVSLDFKELEMNYGVTPKKCEVIGNIYENNKD